MYGSRVNQPPILISQQCTPSVPNAGTLEDAVLWDYSFSFYGEPNTVFDVTYNGDRRTSCDAGMGNTVVIDRLDIIDVQSAIASAQDVSFVEPLAPAIENVMTIDIGGAPATIAQHLSTLLDTLLGNSPFATQSTAIACRYAYDIGGLAIEAPVVLVTRQEVAIGFDDPLVEMIAASVMQWLDAVKPPATNARLVFDLTFWNMVVPDALLLRLANISLPMADVVT
jgi:hypothetical protein